MDNKQFWMEQAAHKGISAVNFDINMHALENAAILPFIPSTGTILDIGCGNGMTTHFLAESRPDTIFVGMDYIPGMIAAANNLPHLNNLSFVVGDAIKLDGREQYDVIISKRLLINIKGYDNKQEVVNRIERLLKPEGIYLMVENFIEPLMRINTIRQELNMDGIGVHDFNEYLTEDCIINMSENNELYFTKEIDFGSMYYFISRVFNAHISKILDYNSDINKLATIISLTHPEIIKGLCPEKLIVYKKYIDVDISTANMWQL